MAARTVVVAQGTKPWDRLSATDLINLYVETPRTPSRVGAVATLDAEQLLDPHGELRITDIREVIERRLQAVSRLRQVIHSGGAFSGRPVWIDDPNFQIRRHVRAITLPHGTTLNDFALQLVNSPLDRHYPLWRLWFVTGLPTGEVALVIGMHHVVADGISTIGLIGALMDGADTGEPAELPSPRPAPTWGVLACDALRDKVAALGRLRAAPAAIVGQWQVMARTRGAPRTSLNRQVGRRRNLATVELDLDEARAVAHAHDGKINDVVLALAGGGVRALLSSRGEPVDDVRLHVSVAVSLRPHPTVRGAGNQAGGIAVRVPLTSDPHRRLRAISAESVQAKRLQLPTAGDTFLISLARIGLLRYMSRHQKMINMVESNVAGPVRPISLLGDPVTSIVPIGTVMGNLALSFLALSYAGRLTIAVQADARGFPDLAVLTAAMRRDWALLSRA